jgi:CRP-like cAMP-binding protein
MHSQEDGYSLLRQTLLRVAPLPASELEYLQRHAEPRSYPAGRALVEAGETPTRCWFLIAGFLRFFYVTESGREYNKAFSRPGRSRARRTNGSSEGSART